MIDVFLVSYNFSDRNLEFVYKISQSNNLKKLHLYIVFVFDDARHASSPSTRSRRDPCPGLGSAGLALGGATFRGSPLGEELGPGSRRRPWPPLVAFAWATFGAEGAGPAGGGVASCQGGGRARPSLHGYYGRQVLQYPADSLGRWLELWSCDGSFCLGVHRSRLRNREWPRLFCSIRSSLAS